MLMGRRNASHRFMPNVFVFPGGRVERADHGPRFGAAIADDMRRLLLLHVASPRPQLPEALIAAAMREAAEETGLHFRAPSDPAGRFSADGVRYVARAITPSFMPRRFDTRFFMIDRRHVLAETEGAVGPDKELTELAWVSHAQALELPINPITRTILKGVILPLTDPDDLSSVPFYRETRGALHTFELA